MDLSNLLKCPVCFEDFDCNLSSFPAEEMRRSSRLPVLSHQCPHKICASCLSNWQLRAVSKRAKFLPKWFKCPCCQEKTAFNAEEMKIDIFACHCFSRMKAIGTMHNEITHDTESGPRKVNTSNESAASFLEQGCSRRRECYSYHNQIQVIYVNDQSKQRNRDISPNATLPFRRKDERAASNKTVSRVEWICPTCHTASPYEQKLCDCRSTRTNSKLPAVTLCSIPYCTEESNGSKCNHMCHHHSQHSNMRDDIDGFDGSSNDSLAAIAEASMANLDAPTANATNMRVGGGQVGGDEPPIGARRRQSVTAAYIRTCSDGEENGEDWICSVCKTNNPYEKKLCQCPSTLRKANGQLLCAVPGCSKQSRGRTLNSMCQRHFNLSCNSGRKKDDSSDDECGTIPVANKNSSLADISRNAPGLSEECKEAGIDHCNEKPKAKKSTQPQPIDNDDLTFEEISTSSSDQPQRRPSSGINDINQDDYSCNSHSGESSGEESGDVQEKDDAENWICLGCGAENASKRKRCPPPCQRWKGGSRIIATNLKKRKSAERKNVRSKSGNPQNGCTAKHSTSKNPYAGLKRRIWPRSVSKYQCGRCNACMVDDFGECRHCLDMKKFGGPWKIRQKCMVRPSCQSPPSRTRPSKESHAKSAKLSHKMDGDQLDQSRAQKPAALAATRQELASTPADQEMKPSVAEGRAGATGGSHGVNLSPPSVKERKGRGCTGEIYAGPWSADNGKQTDGVAYMHGFDAFIPNDLGELRDFAEVACAANNIDFSSSRLTSLIALLEDGHIPETNGVDVQKIFCREQNSTKPTHVDADSAAAVAPAKRQKLDSACASSNPNYLDKNEGCRVRVSMLAGRGNW